MKVVDIIFKDGYDIIVYEDGSTEIIEMGEL